MLGRRALTRHEVASRLRARGHDERDVESAVDRLVATSAIDDAAFARHWIETHAAARGRGRERAIDTLRARGVEESVAVEAWSAAVFEGAVDPAALLDRAIGRRLSAAGPPKDKARWARVYNALLSEGFEPGAVATALRRHGFEGDDL